MILAYVSPRHVNKAVDVFHTCIRAGHVARSAYIALVDALIRMGHCRRARRIRREARDAGIIGAAGEDRPLRCGMRRRA
jgi:hypothetical protein